MKSQEAANSGLRGQYINLLVVILVLVSIVSAIVYFYRSEPDYHRQSMRLLAVTFENNVQQANALWQVNAKPPRVILVQYNKDMKETGRMPVPMGERGWPKADGSEQGCNDLWRALLDQPLIQDGFRVNVRFIQSDQVCQYALSTGPYFEYDMDTGRLNKEHL